MSGIAHGKKILCKHVFFSSVQLRLFLTSTSAFDENGIFMRMKCTYEHLHIKPQAMSPNRIARLNLRLAIIYKTLNFWWDAEKTAAIHV